MKETPQLPLLRFSLEVCLTYQTSCEGVRDLGVSRSGVYTVNFSSYELGLHDVSCDMVNGGGGWMVFQRRENGDQSFKKGWQDYADGFGNVKSEFWLGNDLLHEITASTPHELRVDLEDFEGNFAFAEYSTFLIRSVEKRYQLLCGGYSGNAGDSLANQNEMFFTTIDMDNDRATENCAVLFHGAWWHNSCHECNLNGDYLGGSHESYADGIEWKGFTGLYYSLKFTEMKLRQRSPE
ncbi:hypothetical protein CAPTEDRAFT_202906 [Capitella teleta]|uniref:Fibrinogen C-terminal domain-containing protein n=1 Tax=Capitella teleta TaxID=283909 RepID=R7TUZ0_CAPTE|nr:hypothetical protein CAPTEDRAFT_202906 [Capitella teleta]|eukprot:ELT97539.1 hypothetical protein CAPTEDRAFT_202906 [Capitella teleta]